MKTAIIYSSKSGTAAKCARELYKRIPDCEVFNLDIDNCEIEKFDVVIIGGSIRYENLPKKLRRFMRENQLALEKKKLGFFICCLSDERKDAYFEKCLPAVLYKKSVRCECFGGELDINNQKGIDKFLCKTVLKSQVAKKPRIKIAAIEEFAKTFC